MKESNGIQEPPTSMHMQESKGTSTPGLFTEIDYFNEKMYQDFQAGNIPQEFLPYFNWKFKVRGFPNFDKETAYQLIALAEKLLGTYYDKYPDAYTDAEFYHYDPDNYDIEASLWTIYKGFKEDMYIVSYLEKIDGELSQLIIEGLCR